MPGGFGKRHSQFRIVEKRSRRKIQASGAPNACGKQASSRNRNCRHAKKQGRTQLRFTVVAKPEVARRNKNGPDSKGANRAVFESPWFCSVCDLFRLRLCGAVPSLQCHPHRARPRVCFGMPLLRLQEALSAHLPQLQNSDS